ncbi:hypothetical protein, partial [Mesorhizobium sp. M7A.F.Ca.CA.001.10.2.1]|uniref:hypothetical protein n=1 Tax=Mesorhizobium sp. M7A.F.Ca.CA.001.10.2.1 TaxID=2496720 RepID=UPI0019CFF6B2
MIFMVLPVGVDPVRVEILRRARRRAFELWEAHKRGALSLSTASVLHSGCESSLSSIIRHVGLAALRGPGAGWDDPAAV